ncbi:hypothetical protein QFZ55_000695 [Streptomyces luteogriseus]|nr:hypothetical protein [Streptomyces luteogriseus]
MAATRSRSRMSAVDMVAPEREKPGKSRARIWELPTSIASLKEVSSSPRLCRPIWSAAHITPLPTISEPATTHSEASGPSMSGLAASPTATIGRVA